MIPSRWRTIPVLLLFESHPSSWVSFQSREVFLNTDTNGHKSSLCFRSYFVFEHKSTKITFKFYTGTLLTTFLKAMEKAGLNYVST